MKSRQKIKTENVKSELLNEKQSIGLLKELHLLTPDGHLNADARRKLKQVNHLVQLIRPAWEDLSARYENVNIVDLGAGKSYLGFILYDAFTSPSGTPHVYSVESRADLVTKAECIAQRLDFKNMKFLAQSIEDFDM